MHEIKSVQAIISNPNPREPAGRVTVGYYILRDGLLTMTDSTGAPVRSQSGEKYVQRIEDGDVVPLIAERLTLRIYRARNGGDMAEFNRPLNLPASQGWR